MFLNMIRNSRAIKYETEKPPIHRRPQLRINVTSKCNFRCPYCPGPGYGEGFPSNEKELTAPELGWFVSIASQVGFKEIKITGGEPLLRPDIIEIVGVMKKAKPLINDLQLVTNGSLVTEEIIKGLKNSGLSSITISLDTMRREVFKKLSGGVDALDKVVNAIEIATCHGMKTKINLVLTKENLVDLKSIIDLCSKTGAILKILDLMNIKGVCSFWRTNFVPAEEIYNLLRENAVERTFIEAPGGLGTPLLLYQLKNGAQVMVRDATVRTSYTEECYQCKYFPCHDAKIALRLTHDGKLKKCLLRFDNMIDLSKYIHKKDYDYVKSKLVKIWEEYKTVKTYSNKWDWRNERDRGDERR